MVDYRKEPITSVAPTTPARSRRFRLGFALVALAYVVGLLGASLYVNPHGYFGDTGQFALFNDRASKAEYLAGLAPAELPDAWIIGSSNMMSFQVSTVNRLFGVNAFNLGSFWSRAEDEWAWVNFVLRDLRTSPKLVILGVEPWTFADDTRGPPLLSQYQRRLLNTPALRRYLEDAPDWKFALARVLDSLTLENARLLLRGFMLYGTRRFTFGPFWVQGFNKDGTNAEYSGMNPEPFLPAAVNETYRRLVGAGDAGARIDTLDEERRKLVAAGYIRLENAVNFLPGDRMLPSRIVLFERTLALLAERNIPVAIVVLPVHPYYHDTLVANTRHATHVAEVRRMMVALQQRYKNIRAVLDASHIARFGGDPAAFHDNYHMTPANTDLVLAALCRIWCGSP